MNEELVTLKAHAYDLIAQLEATQAELRAVNARITELATESTDD